LIIVRSKRWGRGNGGRGAVAAEKGTAARKKLRDFRGFGPVRSNAALPPGIEAPAELDVANATASPTGA